MEENNKGHLYSVDLPSPKLLSSGKEIGWVVPEHLRKRWDLRFGKSSELLPELLEEVKIVDIFLHDSEHSYKNMYWEYTTAWECIPKGGLLLSQDITLNSAFREFAKQIPERWYFTRGNAAGIKRTKHSITLPACTEFLGYPFHCVAVVGVKRGINHTRSHGGRNG